MLPKFCLTDNFIPIIIRFIQIFQEFDHVRMSLTLEHFSPLASSILAAMCRAVSSPSPPLIWQSAPWPSSTLNQYYCWMKFWRLKFTSAAEDFPFSTAIWRAVLLSEVGASIFSPLASRVLITLTWPSLAAMWIPRAPYLLGIRSGTPCFQMFDFNIKVFVMTFLNSSTAVSGWPLMAAMCIRVLPSLVRS